MVYSPTIAFVGTQSIGYATRAAGSQTDVVDVTISGGSFADYGIIYANSQNIKILGSTEAPPAPILSSAQFSSDGSQLILRFDSDTDMAGQLTAQFTCSNVFNFTGILDASSCKWSSLSTVSVSLGSLSTIEVGDTIELFENSTKAVVSPVSVATCLAWEYSLPSTGTIVQAPDVAPLSTVSVFVP